MRARSSHLRLQRGPRVGWTLAAAHSFSQRIRGIGEDSINVMIILISCTFLICISVPLRLDASAECELYGGHLAQISSMSINYCLLNYGHAQVTEGSITTVATFLYQEIHGGLYWHSGNDIQSEGKILLPKINYFCPGVYVQADGEMILWTPIWHDSYPKGNTNYNCLLVRLDVTQSGHWYDENCNTAHTFICER